MIKIVTHNGSFHSDDVLAVAALEMYLTKQGEEETEVLRTRAKQTIEQADYALDVGGIYDPQSGRFDH
ncbi:MAG: MYG1 family protein, partial [Candidatus Paceibacterota bacterium]